MESKYRPEIDGLRAIAVCTVIINHFNNNFLQSGYLGVDIFFVISGYVITSSLDTRKSKNFIQFILDFFERRIKRLIPSLIAFVSIISIIVCFFNPYPGLSLKTGLTSLFGLSNIYLFFQSTNYFSEATKLNVFNHTWSLGVEEQFYIIFPLLSWLTGFTKKNPKGNRNLFLILLVLSTISFLSFIYQYKTNQPAAYFLMPNRFWEIASGCLIFIGLKERLFLLTLIKKINPNLVLSAILLIMFFPLKAAVISTILIVFLTCLLIACLKEGTYIFRFLSNKKIVYLGKLSYSLYLWHWGIISISRWTIGIHWWSIPFQLVLIFLISYISFEKIENPLRKKEWSPINFISIFKGLILISLSTLLLVFLGKEFEGKLYTGNKLTKKLITRSRNYIYDSEIIEKDTSYKGAYCHLDKDVDFKNRDRFNKCFLDKGSSQKIFFLGDSHTDHLRETHFMISKEFNISIDGTTVSSCIFPPNIKQNSCGNVQLIQKERVREELKSGDIVVISNRYILDSDNYWLEDEKSVFEINQWSKEIISKGGKIILFAPSPEFKTTIFECTKEWFRPFINKECSVKRERLEYKRKHIYHNINMLSKNILIFDPQNYLCFDNACPMTDKFGNPLYYDSDHFTDYANRKYIYQNFKKLILE